MRQFHLIEIEDQKWCPYFILDGVTDYLRLLERVGKFYRPIFPRLKHVLRKLKPQRIIDLCSGGGGPWMDLYRELQDLNENVPEIYLTDLCPNRAAFETIRRESSNVISFYPEPVDATRVPDGLIGFRTLFSSFHYFPPLKARSILHDAVQSRQGIAIFEMTQRHPLTILFTVLSPFFVFLLTPFIKPFRWERLFWTYLIPVIPSVVTFDGIVSCLHTYTPEELKELTKEFSDEGGAYRWEIGVEPLGLFSAGITYLIGYPVSEK